GFDDLANPTPFILTAHSSFPQRLDAFGALCALLLATHLNLKGYKDVISKLRAAQNKRNKFIHNTISFDPASKKYLLASATARQSLKGSVMEITSAEIHEVSREIHVAGLALHELITGRRYEPIWRRT